MVHPKYLFGIIAVGIYAAVIALVFYYFGYHRTEESTRFTAEKGEAITVNLQSPAPRERPRTSRSGSKTSPGTRQRTRPKPITTPEPPKKKPTRPVQKAPAKKAFRPKNLFAHVNPSRPAERPPKKAQKPPSQSTRSPKGTSRSDRRSIRQQNTRQKGIEDRYLARVQDRLYGWPTQPGFVGAKMTIGLNIRPDGRFTYEVLTPSADPEFNRTLERYLNALQAEGFGPVPTGRSYSFKVDIVAK